MKQKINITLLTLALLILFLIIFGVSPIFSQIKKESENFITQRNKLAELELKIQNFKNFEDNFKQYQPNFQKIDGLFISYSEPIKFIEFLEKEAANSKLSIEITPPILSKTKNELGIVVDFHLILKGEFADFSEFLEKLEAAPYLVRVSNLDIRKNAKPEVGITANLSIIALAK
ncbi:MAG: hypothetical protein HYV47_02480 [Candidatus Nealsonbacteria bacterium]|nr:hypothetical protein [Candidatus Nealsonbacteria bacterium]